MCGGDCGSGGGVCGDDCGSGGGVCVVMTVVVVVDQCVCGGGEPVCVCV